MPVRFPLVTEHASRVLLEGLIDYAGLFPPAALNMPPAVRHYAHYRASGAGWMLGRFVCPANALELFSQSADPLLPRDAGAIPWRLSVTGSGDVAADLAAIKAFNERHRVCFDECGALVDAYEAKVATTSDIDALHTAVPVDLMTYVEVPVAQASTLLPHVAARGRRAKIRMGGVVADAFPAAEAVVHFLQTCVDCSITAKATAGLHHPLRGAYRLTYADDAPSGRMYGFVNLWLAAALVLAGDAEGHTASLAAQLLGESNARAFQVDESRILWHAPSHDVVIDRALLQRTRETLLVSFGSCSFTEPTDEFRALGWL